MVAYFNNTILDLNYNPLNNISNENNVNIVSVNKNNSHEIKNSKTREL